VNASKLWNIARWTCDRIWSETGTIPEDGPLKAYWKNHQRYADLNSALPPDHISGDARGEHDPSCGQGMFVQQASSCKP